MSAFPTREELNDMPIHRLENLDVRNSTEQAILQEVLDAKRAKAPLNRQVYRGDFPDILTKADEDRYQAIVNQREKSLRPQDREEETSIDMNRHPVTFSPAPVLVAPTIEATPIQTQELHGEGTVNPDGTTDTIVTADPVVTHPVERTEAEVLAEIANLEASKTEITNQ